jgi:pimeloyl-ACP methyl ester carboxylesterase
VRVTYDFSDHATEPHIIVPPNPPFFPSSYAGSQTFDVPAGSGGTIFAIECARSLFSRAVQEFPFQIPFPPPPKPQSDPLPAGVIRSPTAAPASEDTLAVADGSSPGLDTNCTFGGEGPLLIDLQVARVVGPVDAAGRLLNSGPLKANGYLSTTARLSVQAWDIDADEIDLVTFNGHPLGPLEGSNDRWSKTEFTFPIEWVNFGRNAQGVNLTGINQIRIDIDTTSGQPQKRCTSVDWVTLDFDAIAPIFLVHGVNAGSDSWESPTSGITDHLRSLGIPFSNEFSVIELEPNGSIKNNGILLAKRVGQLAHAFGAKKCHLVAHSKGGNDSREYLLRHYDPKRVEVLSLYTLSTPFHGSVVADIISERRLFGIDESSNSLIQSLLDVDLVLPDFLFPDGDGLRDNRTDILASYNSRNRHLRGFKFYNFAADADLDDDGHVSLDEASPIVRRFLQFLNIGPRVADANYLTLGSVRSVRKSTITRIVATRGGVTTVQVPIIEVSQATSAFRENDMAVTVRAHSIHRRSTWDKSMPITRPSNRRASSRAFSVESEPIFQ